VDGVTNSVKKKVAYLFLNASDQDNSVQRKVASQINGLMTEGVDVAGLFFTFRDRAETYGLHNIQSVNVEKVKGNFFLGLRKKVRMTRDLLRWANQNVHRYDVLYLRNYRPGIRWWWFMIKYGKKCITEHQTIELAEIRALSAENPFGRRSGRFLRRLEHTALPAISEKIWGSLALGFTSKIVAVTREIGNYEYRRAFPKKPHVHIVSNGIDVEAFPLRTAPVYDGSKLILLMLVGGSTEVDWHGIDLIVEGIKQYKGPVQIQLWLAGNADILKKHQEHFIRHLDFCNKQKLDSIANEVHLGLGSFALERKGIKEACSLKMREYAARGIFVVCGQEDTDYETLFMSGLAMKCKSMEPPDMELVVAFYEKLQKRTASPQQIREIALREIDNKVKMRSLKDVILS
jgi:glycosyltransferase involved in cell wall biosynthesis